MSTVRTGDVVEVMAGPHLGKRGRVLKLHTDGQIQIDLADAAGLLRGIHLWVPADDVTPADGQLKRLRTSPRRRREMRIEVRRVCPHVYIFDLCPDCGTPAD